MSGVEHARAADISLMVARAANGVIGRDNALPWHLPADLQRFKSLTMGKPMLMGRRTFDSIGRALPGRVSLVLTRDRAWQAPGAIAVHSLDEALARAGNAAELVVIGGADVFRLALPRAQRIYLTQIHAEIAGDTVFPALKPDEWREVDTKFQAADAKNGYAMTFSTLERRPTPASAC